MAFLRKARQLSFNSVARCDSPCLLPVALPNTLRRGPRPRAPIPDPPQSPTLYPPPYTLLFDKFSCLHRAITRTVLATISSPLARSCCVRLAPTAKCSCAASRGGCSKGCLSFCPSLTSQTSPMLFCIPRPASPSQSPASAPTSRSTSSECHSVISRRESSGSLCVLSTCCLTSCLTVPDPAGSDSSRLTGCAGTSL